MHTRSSQDKELLFCSDIAKEEKRLKREARERDNELNEDIQHNFGETYEVDIMAERILK